MHVASNGMAQFVGSSHTQVKATTDSVYISAAEHLYLDNGTRNTYSTIFRDGTGEYARFKNARLGLGTTGPDEKLDVRGDIQLKQTGDTAVTVLGDANRSGADSHIAALRGKWNGTAVGTFMVMSGPDTTNKDDGQLTFQTASAGTLAERMRIDETGNVGIGTTTPDYTLELENTAPQLGFNDTNGRKFYLMSQSDKFWLGDATGGTTPLVVDSAGKVGIGTTSPDSKMTVQGDLDIPVNSRFRAGSASSDTGVDIYHDGSNNYTLIENRPSGGDLIFRQMHNGKDYIFKADNDSGTEQEIMRIDGSNARVGIGTNSPGYDLEVYKADADGDPTININDGNNYLRAYISDAGYVQSNHPLYLWSRGSGQYTMLRSENEYVEINAGDYINFKTSGGQAARLLGNGKFGIGTTSPDQYLHVKAGSTDQALKLESTDGNVDATFTDTGGSGIIRFATNIFKFYTAADYSVNPLNTCSTRSCCSRRIDISPITTTPRNVN